MNDTLKECWLNSPGPRQSGSLSFSVHTRQLKVFFFLLLIEMTQICSKFYLIFERKTANF